MNHDYCHCLDYDPALCPKECFRAQLSEDLKKRGNLYNNPLTWAHMLGEDVCKRKKVNNNR